MDDKKEKTVSPEKSEKSGKRPLTEEELKKVTAGGIEGGTEDNAGQGQSLSFVFPGTSGFP